jgi:hypothetical protein
MLLAKFDAMSRPAQSRPLWQRILYPFAGIAVFAAGVASCFLPFLPGIPLLAGGLYLMCFVSPRLETWARGRLGPIQTRMKAWLRRLPERFHSRRR